MFDVLIQNGRVVDGTGQTWFRASVGITDGTVTLLRGDTSSHARESSRVIDASNYVVCPGFIDMHSHSDLALLSQLDPQQAFLLVLRHRCHARPSSRT